MYIDWRESAKGNKTWRNGEWSATLFERDFIWTLALNKPDADRAEFIKIGMIPIWEATKKAEYVINDELDKFNGHGKYRKQSEQKSSQQSPGDIFSTMTDQDLRRVISQNHPDKGHSWTCLAIYQRCIEEIDKRRKSA